MSIWNLVITVFSEVSMVLKRDETLFQLQIGDALRERCIPIMKENKEILARWAFTKEDYEDLAKSAN